jgi:arylsulfatase A-like enzyme
LGSGPPREDEYTIRYPKALTREKSLNKKTSDIPLSDFVFRTVQVGETNRHGLHLPAPSTIRFAVDVPEDAVLRFDASVLPPEAALKNSQSDGADLVITVKSGGDTHVIDTLLVSLEVQTHRIDLSPYSNKAIELEFRTLPRGSAELDYVFLAEPTVYQPQKNAPQIALIFLDTLRADAMSLYGYERETSPKIDAWAKDAAVFTQARSVAPWTLPSARTMVSGTHPERWDKIDRLQARLAKNGWATGMIAGNVYLSSNFQMAEDWGTHRCINWPQASVQVQRSLQFLNAHEDQPSFLLMHIMDMHLPYKEPLQYRSLFVDETPEGIDLTGYFVRHEVIRMAKKGGDKFKEYIRGRYDNNMRYIDDQISDFIAQLRDDAIVMIVSDHGEEFWEHDAFEHGHTLYDEVLRIPMILKGPGVQSGRFDAPTSLIDVAPTLAMMAGVEASGMLGEDLRGLTHGQTTQRFEERPLSFGRPLYGLRRWGSLQNGIKYTTHEGEEEVYNLNNDPGEHQNIIATFNPEKSREALGQSLDRPFVPVFRMVLNKVKSSSAVSVKFNHPALAAWVGNDPTMKGRANVEMTDKRVKARWPKQKGMVEVYILPTNELAATIDVEFTVGNRTERFSFDTQNREPPKPGESDTLLTARVNGRKLTINTTWAPIPSDIDGSISGFDAEVAGDLESLGYIEKD